jgi:uncharacterized membrane protein
MAACLAAILVLPGLGLAAQAEIIVCNDFRVPIAAAFARQVQGSFVAAGWWRVAANDCQPAEFPFESTTLYYAADSDNYPDGRNTSRDHWGSNVRLFVTSQKFNFDGADRPRRGANAEMFTAYEIPPQHLGKPATITFHFVHGSTTINITTSP